MSNGTDIGINTGIDEILESALLDYNTGILRNWKIIELDTKHILWQEKTEKIEMVRNLNEGQT